MRETRGDLWAQFGRAGHRVAISTNGFVKRNGEAVMGRGCARQACEIMPGIKLKHLLGAYIRTHGNVPGYLHLGDAPPSMPSADRLMILPVKHNWWEKASLLLVQTSIDFLRSEGLSWMDWTFHVPRLGCGNGRLDWERDVRPLMLSLPDNVEVHH